MLLEITSLTPLVAPVEEALADLTTDDVEDRLLMVLDTLDLIALSDEIAMRTALRVYQDT